MYTLIKVRNDDFNIQIDSFIIGQTYRNIDGNWYSVIKDKDGNIVLRYFSKNRKKSVEGLIRSIIIDAYQKYVKEGET